MQKGFPAPTYGSRFMTTKSGITPASVCPYNREQDANAHPFPRVGPTVHARYTPREHLAEGLSLLEVLGWTAEDRQAAFQGSALKRVKLDMLKRNALIAAGNALETRDEPALRRRIEILADEPSEPELVRHTARQVLRRLDEPEAGDSSSRQ